MNKWLQIGVLLLSTYALKAQVGIGTNNPNTSAKLEIASTTQGFLPPRMTVAQRAAIVNPAQGLLIYCIDCGANGEPEYFNGSNWLTMAGNAATRATPTITISVGTYTFSGAAQGPNVATNTGTGTNYTFTYAGTGSTTYGPSATRPTNAGSYSVTASVSASTDGNYAAASNTVTFTIAKATPTVTPIIGNYTYNLASPAPQGPNSATNTGTGSSYTFSYVGTGVTSYGPSATRPTDGGTYNVTVTVAASPDGNYAAGSSSPTLFRISTSLSIGNSYGGGKVAYILQVGDNGYDAAQQHGLIISGDLTSSLQDIRWGTNGVTTGATSLELGSGPNNTNLIIASEGAGTSYAAGLAKACSSGGYNNWYLPSHDEMLYILPNRNSVGPFNRAFYWTSTEIDVDNSYKFYVGNNGPAIIPCEKNVAQAGVRAVRSF
jgi:hypothetical protein